MIRIFKASYCLVPVAENSIFDRQFIFHLVKIYFFCVKPTLSPLPSTSSLRVFPMVRPLATTVALSSTDMPLPAQIFITDDVITNLDYDATLRKNGLYLYHDGTELVHYTPKSLDETFWTLPIQRPLAHANAVLSLPSDKQYTYTTVYICSALQALTQY